MYQACAICREQKEVHLRYGNLIICDPCFQKNEELTAINMTPQAQSERVESMNQAVIMARQTDATIQVRADVFNAHTAAIVELKNAIDADESISNKAYTLAEELVKRFTHFKTVVFDLNQQLIEANTQQKAIQTYLNTLANTLRAEEREKLRLQDVNYKPNPIKVTKVRALGTVTAGTRAKKQPLDKVALKKYAKELGVSEFILQQIVVQKNFTVEKAAEHLKKIMAAE